MGWASANEIFDPVADVLIGSGADAGVQQAVCSALIGSLLRQGWDTGEESLGLYRDHAPVVAAFREHGITVMCGEEHLEETWVCEEEEGHEGDHRDWEGNTWPQ